LSRIRRILVEVIPLQKELDKLLTTEAETTTDLIKLKKQEIKLLESLPAASKKALAIRNQEIAAKKEELKVLQQLGIEKEKQKEDDDLDDVKADLEELKTIESIKRIRAAREADEAERAGNAELAFNLRVAELERVAEREINISADTANQKLLIEEKLKDDIAALDRAEAERKARLKEQEIEDFKILVNTILDATAEASRLAGERDIRRANDAVNRQEEVVAAQRKLSETEVVESLVFEEAELVKARLRRREEEERAAKRAENIALILAFLNQFAELSKTNPDTAIQEAFKNVFLAKAISTGLAEAFYTGGYTGDGDKREVAGKVHYEEFVINEETTTKMGLKGKNMKDFNKMYSRFPDKKLQQLAGDYESGSIAGRMSVMTQLMGGDNSDMLKATKDQTSALVKGMEDNRTTYNVDYESELRTRVEVKIGSKTYITNYILRETQTVG